MSETYVLALRDSAGAVITGKVKADFDLTYYVSGVDTATTAITITEVGVTGDYLVVVPDPAEDTDHSLVLEDISGSLGAPDGWLQRIDWPSRILNSELVTDVINGGGTTSYTGPVSNTGDVEIIRGDDYYHADSRALTWSDTSWPVLTGGSILLTVRDKSDVALIENAAGVVSGASECYVELTSTQTTVAAGIWKFDLQATLASGHVVTLESGNFTIHNERVRA